MRSRGRLRGFGVIFWRCLLGGQALLIDPRLGCANGFKSSHLVWGCFGFCYLNPILAVLCRENSIQGSRRVRHFSHASNMPLQSCDANRPRPRRFRLGGVNLRGLGFRPAFPEPIMDEISRGIATAALTLQSVLLQALVHKGVITARMPWALLTGA
jgi:hypothetical protein